MSDEQRSDKQRETLIAEYRTRAKRAKDKAERSAQMERDFLEKKVLNHHANEAVNDARLEKSLFSMWLFDHHEELLGALSSGTSRVASPSEEWTLEKAARAVIDDYEKSGEAGGDALEDLRTALKNAAPQAPGNGRVVSSDGDSQPAVAAPFSATPPSVYDTVADAVSEVAEAASVAFRLAGFEPGEWDGDNIVKDVSNGIAADIARMGDLIRDLRARIASSARLPSEEKS